MFSKGSAEFSPLKENNQDKLKQMSIIYRNQSMLDKLKKVRANGSTINAKLDSFSNMRGDKQALPSTEPKKIYRNLSQEQFMPSPHKEPNGTLLHSNGNFKNSPTESIQKINKPLLQHYRMRSYSDFKVPVKDSFTLPHMRASKKPYLKSMSASFATGNKLLDNSFQLNSKENTPALKNSFSEEKMNKSYENTTSTHWKRNLLNPHQYKHIESKLEAIISIKSIEPQRANDLNSLFDNLIDVVRENEVSSEDQKLSNILKKIRLAYDIFFQNYMQYQNGKIMQAQDYNKRLEKECDILEQRVELVGNEIDILQKENEQLEHKNDLLRNAASLLESLSIINQKQNGETVGSISELNVNGQKNLQELETMKLIIAEQQNVILSMKKKEGKLVQLLYACKQRGFDIEKIYYEDVKNNSYNLSEEKEDVNEYTENSQGDEEIDSEHPESELNESAPETDPGIYFPLVFLCC